MAQAKKTTRKTRTTRATRTTKAAPAAPAKPEKAKLTKRNATPTTAVLVVTDKAPRLRSKHTQVAWEMVAKAAPAPAATLAALPVFADKQFASALVSGPAFVSYMQRRGYLAVK